MTQPYLLARLVDGYGCVGIEATGLILSAQQIDVVIAAGSVIVAANIGWHVPHRVAAPSLLGRVWIGSVNRKGIVKVIFTSRQLQVDNLGVVNIALGNLGAAQTDINFIRVTSGGLDPVTLDSGNALDQLLYEKRLSLLFEGGHRWIDMRRYNKLDELPLDLPGHIVERMYPIPIQESTARTGS